MSTRDPDSREGTSEPPAAEAAERAPVWTRHEPRIAGATDPGVVRTVNQDAWGRFDDPSRCEIVVIVADGLGGHRGGEEASRLAVSVVGERAFAGPGEPPSRLRAAIEEANTAILEASEADPRLDGMGTTVVVLLLAESGRSYVAHVGDSRLYRLRGGRLEPLTEDHSLVATLVREGLLGEAEARTDPRRNQILRALGVRPELEVEVAPVELQPGDAYLLCTDGLNGLIDDDAIGRLIDGVRRPETAVARLIEAANDAGGTDNVTCVLAQIPDPMAKEGLRDAAARLIDSTRSVFTRRDDG